MAHPLIILAATELRRLIFVTSPIGGVKMLSNETAPEDIVNGVITGWMECNGRALDSTIYPALFTVIGIRYGDGTDGIGGGGGNDFNIPDMRGQFIRGWNHSASPDADGNGRDPDAAVRGDGSSQGGTGVTGQAVADNVGSVQGDFYRDHTHTISHVAGGTITSDSANPGRSINGPTTTSTNMQPPPGNETRPGNITLLYIIKA